jgi:phosphoribosylaminoimidazole carboxylase
VETIQQNNICHLVYAPARIPAGTRRAAQLLAEESVRSFQGAGVFGVEMFWFEGTGNIALVFTWLILQIV